MSAIPTEQDVRALVAQRGRKFSKLEAVYTSPAFPPEGPELETGLPFNYVQLYGVTCERCAFFNPGPRYGTCQVTGLPSDWGGEAINPKGLCRFYIAKEPRLIDKSLSSVYMPEITIRKLLEKR